MSITGITTCTECKLPVTVKSHATNLIVCSHCYAPVKKLEGYLQERVNLLITKDTFTPVQIGTYGQWANKKFEIIGRVHCVFEGDEYTNNWTMLFDDGSIMMLVERCGEFAVYEKTTLEIDVAFSRIGAMDPGEDTIELNRGKHYILERKAYGKNMEVEGETWLFDDDGKFKCLEVATRGGGRYALIETVKNGYLVFKVHYHTLAELGCKELRTQQLGAVTHEVNCTKCEGVIRLHSWPFAGSYTCMACGAAYEIKNGESNQKRRMPLDKKPAIPLYSKGFIRGTQYQLIGFAEKEDDESFKWREYTLFNPAYGYAYLSEFNGHWLFLKETADAPVVIGHKTMSFDYAGSTFRLYNKYWGSVVDCCGEFEGNVATHSKVQCREFIDPPKLWSCEMNDRGLNWFYGTHISKNELYTAFGKDISLPFTVGVGSVQPSVANISAGFNTLLRSVLFVGLVIFTLFLFTKIFNRETVVYENSIYLPDSTSIVPVITPGFKLDKWRSNMEFTITAPVDNNWLELAITLVNKDNGKEYAVQQGVEKYSGYSDGERWIEGSDHETVMIHSIPAGNYFLRIEPAKGTGILPYFSLTATYDVPIWRNFFIFVLLALLPLAVLMIADKVREGRRWQNSPFYHSN